MVRALSLAQMAFDNVIAGVMTAMEHELTDRTAAFELARANSMERQVNLRNSLGLAVRKLVNALPVQAQGVDVRATLAVFTRLAACC